MSAPRTCRGLSLPKLSPFSDAAFAARDGVSRRLVEDAFAINRGDLSFASAVAIRTQFKENIKKYHGPRFFRSMGVYGRNGIVMVASLHGLGDETAGGASCEAVCRSMSGLREYGVARHRNCAPASPSPAAGDLEALLSNAWFGRVVSTTKRAMESPTEATA